MCSRCLALLDPLRTRLPFGLRKRERAARDEPPARRAVGERTRAAEGGGPCLVGILAQELACLIVLGVGLSSLKCPFCCVLC